MWESSLAELLLQVLDNKRLSREGEGMIDKWLWRDVESTDFFVKSTHNILLREESSVCGNFFTEFWTLKTLPSSHFTAWRVLSNAIVTKDNLLRCGIPMVCDRCPLCGVEEVTVRHFFLV